MDFFFYFSVRVDTEEVNQKKLNILCARSISYEKAKKLRNSFCPDVRTDGVSRGTNIKTSYSRVVSKQTFSQSQAQSLTSNNIKYIQKLLFI